MADEMATLRLRRVIGELRRLDRLLDQRQLHSHVTFMRSVSKNFDARDMVRLSNEFQGEVRSLELSLSGLIGAGRSCVAAVGNHPPREIAPGRFSSSPGGDVAEFRALTSRLSRRLTSLSKELGAFRIESTTALNDPGRYGDAAMPNPVNDLFSFAQSVLDLIRRIKRL